MNITDLKRVNELVNIKNKLEQELKIHENKMQNEEMSNYWLCVSQHKDGSGWKFDLSGCELAHEVVNSVVDIIKNKIACCNLELQELGVSLKDTKEVPPQPSNIKEKE